MPITIFPPVEPTREFTPLNQEPEVICVGGSSRAKKVFIPSLVEEL
jgi:hypothetical protein